MNILLLQLKRIGDLVLTTPAIAAVRDKFPNARVTLVISTECAALAPAISHVDRILVVRRGLSDLKTLFAIARDKFDYSVDFTQNDRSAVFTLLSGARKRTVPERVKQKSKLRARVYNEFVPAHIRDMHTVNYNLALLKPLGIKTPSRMLHLDFPRAARESADRLRLEAKIDNEFIIFHPGSARTEKFWPAERWAAVIKYASSKWKLTAMLSGTSSELERQHIDEIKSNLKVVGPLLPSTQAEAFDTSASTTLGGSYREAATAAVVDLSGKTDLLTLTALIEQARLLVTVDSAPMHLAAATNTPQVILFGPTNPFHWRPLDSPALVLQGQSTTPFLEFSADQPEVPMSQISTQAVIDAMEALLSRPNIGRARLAS